MSNKNESFPAHIANNRVQSCSEHNLNTAVYAKTALSNVGLEKAAYLAGLLHDSGKCTEQFKQYIQDAAEGKTVKKGSVIHSFAGVYYLLSKHHNETGTFEAITAELIAYAIGAHHGLFDCIDENKKNGFTHRLNKQPRYDKKAIENYLLTCKANEELQNIFRDAVGEVKSLSKALEKLVEDSTEKRSEYCFYLGLVARLLSAAVMDGDRRDTVEFMAGKDFSSGIRADTSLWRMCRKSLEEMIEELPVVTEIHKARRNISDECLSFAKEPPGIYRLNVPTGGGKTLSSMRYALAHAEKHGKKRIIYTAPLISILDQNAQVIRRAIQNDDIVLEHHSNIVHSNDEEDMSRYELLSDTWDSPIIITTLVQLLNTFFSGKTSCIRRFQSLCDSIIIIDEVQSLPSNMLSLFNLTLNFLNSVMGATVILCSATQPCLEDIAHKLLVSSKPMILKEKQDAFERIFKRTRIEDKGCMSLKDIPNLAGDILEKIKSLLIVCNTKKEAVELYHDLSKQYNNCYYLSAAMCMAHRKEALREVYGALESRDKTICVSTQVIEAGVDISFDSVIRLTAGIDSMVQAAGRCNRNGERESVAPVYIVQCQEEKLGKLQEIKTAQGATNELLFRYAMNPDDYDNDLASEHAVRFYYRTLYHQISTEHGGHFDYPIKDTTLFKLLSDNRTYAEGGEDAEKYALLQAFKTAGELFEVFDFNTWTIIVPYKEGSEIIAELFSEKAQNSVRYLKELLNRAKEYTVSAYEWQIQKLKDAGGIRAIGDGRIMVLDEEYYKAKIGLSVESGGKEASEWSTQIL